MPSKQVPFRLTDEDRAAIARIRHYFGLPSDAAAVRYAVQRAVEQLPPPPKPPKGKRGA